MQTLRGIIHGKTIELTEDPGLPDGRQVKVSLEPTPKIDPRSAEALEAFKSLAGGWSDDVEGLDQFLEWNRQQRKWHREIPE